MAFIRRKRVKGRIYFQLVENVRVKGKYRQRVVKHLGNEDSAKRYCSKNGIAFKVKEYETTPSAYFSTLNQASEFVTALKGRNEIPVKFIYLQNGAEKWGKLVYSEKYKIGLIEEELIRESVAEILKEPKSRINLIDLGCGTGEKAMLFLEKMKDRKYVALDISEQMLDLAKSRLSERFSNLNSEFHKIDFEEGNFAHITESLREKNHPYNLMLLLGNTIGNVSDMSRVLSNIRESMTLDDYLLIGIEMFDIDRIRSILDHYTGSQMVKNCLLTSLEQFGITQDDVDLEVRFNKERGQVEARFVLKEEKNVICGNKRIRLEKGGKILVMISYKTTPKHIQILLADTGFVIKRLFLNENEDYALILCKPTSL